MTCREELEIKLGEEAYKGYCKSSDNKSLISGAVLPEWNELKVEIQTAWIEAAKAVLAYRQYCLELFE